MIRKISETGIDHIKDFELLRLKAYIPVEGDVPTIGYGHTNGVQLGDKITKREADEFLRYDIAWVEASLNRLVSVPLDQSQYDALASFVFNIGTSQFSTSTLLKELNRGHYDKVDHQLSRWVYSGKNKLNGLVRRRKAEADLFHDYAPVFVASGVMPQTVGIASGKSIVQTVKDSRTAKTGLGASALGGLGLIDQINAAGQKVAEVQSTFESFIPNANILLAVGLTVAGAYICYLKWSDIQNGRAY